MAGTDILFSTGEAPVIKFFNKLSDSTESYICSYDYYGQMINDFTGNEEERALLDFYIPGELRHEMFERLTLPFEPTVFGWIETVPTVKFPVLLESVVTTI